MTAKGDVTVPDDGLMDADDDDGKTWRVPRLMSMWRHKKRGSVYAVIDYVTMQHNSDLDMRPFIVYLDIETNRRWTRDVEEFLDGRFEFMPPVRPVSNQSPIPSFVQYWLDEHDFTPVKKDKAFPPCADCQQTLGFQDHYMVDDEVWDSVAKSDEILHAWCLSTRLGRPLRLGDFTFVPINQTYHYLIAHVQRP